MYSQFLVRDRNKPLLAEVKFFLKAGAASISPPIGPILGQYGVDMMGFCREFNEYSKFIKVNTILPVTVFVFNDRSFIFQIKKPTISFLLKSVFYNMTKISRSMLLRGIFKVSIIKGHKNTNKFFLCKMIYGTFSSLGISIKD